jgi:anaerobic selenocysteine-containing dehydrogenase
VADDWFGITPGTDVLLIIALIHGCSKAGKARLYLARFTNASCIVNEDPKSVRTACCCATVTVTSDEQNTGHLAPWDGQVSSPTLPAHTAPLAFLHRCVPSLMAGSFS